ncbi:MAG: glycoside hydrolase family 2 protein, partial [Bacteroidota bacterium]
EFGFQAPANSKTWNEVTLPEDRTPQHPVIEHHNKQVEGQERLYRFQAAHYNVAVDFNDFVYLGQLVQANALKTAVEHWRRRKFRTAGSMFWQLNDCWPVSSWAVIDSALRPKASYFYAKRFYAEVLISLKKNGNSLEVWGTNDTLGQIKCSMRLSVQSFAGELFVNILKDVTLKPNSSTVLHRFDELPVSEENKYTRYVAAALTDGTNVVSENRFFFAEPKHLLFPSPKISWKLDRQNLFIQSNLFVKDVHVEIEGYDADFSDNYFDLDAGCGETIAIDTRQEIPEIEKKIKIRTLVWNL